jgi:hypothetical protein
MKSEYHDIWEKLDALKQQPLITEEALQHNQNQTMDRVASLSSEKIIHHSFTYKQKIMALLAAACLAGGFWLLLQPASMNQSAAENQPMTFSTMQPDTISETQIAETSEQKNPLVTDEGNMPPLQKGSESLENNWSSLTAEEMEIYLIENDEF